VWPCVEADDEALEWVLVAAFEDEGVWKSCTIPAIDKRCLCSHIRCDDINDEIYRRNCSSFQDESGHRGSIFNPVVSGNLWCLSV
jgi:hypothetical protein